MIDLDELEREARSHLEGGENEQFDMIVDPEKELELIALARKGQFQDNRIEVAECNMAIQLERAELYERALREILEPYERTTINQKSWRFVAIAREALEKGK